MSLDQGGPGRQNRKHERPWTAAACMLARKKLWIGMWLMEIGYVKCSWKGGSKMFVATQWCLEIKETNGFELNVHQLCSIKVPHTDSTMNNKCDLIAPIKCALARQVLSGHTETRKGRPIDNFFGTVIQHSTVILSCVSLLAIMVHYLREHHTALTEHRLGVGEGIWIYVKSVKSTSAIAAVA